MAKKPTLETHSSPCCGECQYCVQQNKLTGCFVNPPQYIYGDDESPTFMQSVETSTIRPACKEFKRKGTH